MRSAWRCWRCCESQNPWKIVLLSALGACVSEWNTEFEFGELSLLFCIAWLRFNCTNTLTRTHRHWHMNNSQDFSDRPIAISISLLPFHLFVRAKKTSTILSLSLVAQVAVELSNSRSNAKWTRSTGRDNINAQFARTMLGESIRTRKAIF